MKTVDIAARLRSTINTNQENPTTIKAWRRKIGRGGKGRFMDGCS
jgi:hypothetical protein